MPQAAIPIAASIGSSLISKAISGGGGSSSTAGGFPTIGSFGGPLTTPSFNFLGGNLSRTNFSQLDFSRRIRDLLGGNLLSLEELRTGRRPVFGDVTRQVTDPSRTVTRTIPGTSGTSGTSGTPNFDARISALQRQIRAISDIVSDTDFESGTSESIRLNARKSELRRELQLLQRLAAGRTLDEIDRRDINALGIDTVGSRTVTETIPGQTRNITERGITGFEDTGGGLPAIDRALLGLQEDVRPGFGRLTDEVTRTIRERGEQTIGNLREQLGARGVLGASFAQGQIASVSKDVANQERLAQSEAFVQEIAQTQSILQQRLGLKALDASILAQELSVIRAETEQNSLQIQRELTELGIATEFASSVNILERQRATAQAALEFAENQAGGEFSGALGDTFEQIFNSDFFSSGVNLTSESNLAFTDTGGGFGGDFLGF